MFNVLTNRYSKHTIKYQSENTVRGKCQHLHVSAPEYGLRDSAWTNERKANSL